MFMTPHPANGDEPGHVPAREQTYALLRVPVEKAVAAERFRPLPVDAICQVLWSAVHGVSALLVTYGRDFPCAPPVPDLVDQVIDNALRGMRPS
jgi:hypothetical protein